MSIGASVFLIAVGAILEFAVTVEILMVVGAIGLFISLLWAGRAAPWGTWSRRDTVVRERDARRGSHCPRLARVAGHRHPRCHFS